MVEEINSSSDSEVESEEEGGGDLKSNVPNCDNGVLTLVDDVSSLLIRPRNIDDAEVAGEVEDEKQQEQKRPVGKSVTKGNVSSLSFDNAKRKKRKRKMLFVCLTSCKYDSVRRATQQYGFKEVGDEDEWTLYWTDLSVSLERVMDMKKFQKVNHFPGMSEICRKDLLARNMNRMLRTFPKDYNIFPKSWCLPGDYAELQAYARQKKGKTYILKPESGCQGRGIWMTRFPREIKPNEHMLCQQYLSRPLLIDGFKFDMRIYALVTAIDPLRIFVFKDGLGRFATNKYTDPHSSNVSNVFMHLTNYAINKNSNDFIRDDEAGSKRRLSTINKWLKDHGYDIDKIWSDIDDLIIKTLISALPVLKHNYRTCFPNYIGSSVCFEILGFDVILDRKAKPVLLEVNHSPSFTTDSDLDMEIKDTLLFDTLNLVNFDSVDRRKFVEEERRRAKERLFQKQSKKESKEELDKALLAWLDETTAYEDSHLGNFRRIYPTAMTDKYDKLFQNNNALFQETASYKARFECARQQREDLIRKQEKNESFLKKKREPMRPESPGTRPRRSKANEPRASTRSGLSMETRSAVNSVPPDKYKLELLTVARRRVYQHSADSKSESALHLQFTDSLQPVAINEEDELERIRGLLQRENLVRGLGIVEHVYRILQAPLNVANNKTENSKTYYNQNEQQLYHRSLPNALEGHINISGTGIARGSQIAPYSQQFAQLGLHTGLTTNAGWLDVLPSNNVPKQAKDARLMPLRTPPYKPHRSNGIHTRVTVLASDFLPSTHRPTQGPLIRFDDPRLESAFGKRKAYVESQRDSGR